MDPVLTKAFIQVPALVIVCWLVWKLGGGVREMQTEFLEVQQKMQTDQIEANARNTEKFNETLREAAEVMGRNVEVMHRLEQVLDKHSPRC